MTSSFTKDQEKALGDLAKKWNKGSLKDEELEAEINKILQADGNTVTRELILMELDQAVARKSWLVSWFSKNGQIALLLLLAIMVAGLLGSVYYLTAQMENKSEEILAAVISNSSIPEPSQPAQLTEPAPPTEPAPLTEPAPPTEPVMQITVPACASFKEQIEISVKFNNQGDADKVKFELLTSAGDPLASPVTSSKELSYKDGKLIIPALKYVGKFTLRTTVDQKTYDEKINICVPDVTLRITPEFKISSGDGKYLLIPGISQITLTNLPEEVKWEIDSAEITKNAENKYVINDNFDTQKSDITVKIKFPDLIDGGGQVYEHSVPSILLMPYKPADKENVRDLLIYDVIHDGFPVKNESLVDEKKIIVAGAFEPCMEQTWVWSDNTLDSSYEPGMVIGWIKYENKGMLDIGNPIDYSKYISQAIYPKTPGSKEYCVFSTFALRGHAYVLKQDDGFIQIIVFGLFKK